MWVFYGFNTALTSSSNNTFTGVSQIIAQPTTTAISSTLAYDLNGSTANITGNVINLSDDANQVDSFGIYIQDGTADIENTSIKLQLSGSQVNEVNNLGIEADTSQVTLKNSSVDL